MKFVIQNEYLKNIRILFASWRSVDLETKLSLRNFSKKNEWLCFSILTAQKYLKLPNPQDRNLFVCLLEKATARQFCFGIYWPLIVALDYCKAWKEHEFSTFKMNFLVKNVSDQCFRSISIKDYERGIHLLLLNFAIVVNNVKVWVFWEGHKIWRKSSSYFWQERRVLCAQKRTCQKVGA